MLTKREKGLVRALMYPVQYEQNPSESVARVIRHVIEERSLNASRDEYSLAIRSALDSNEKLVELLPNAPEESAFRKYLKQVEAHLAWDSVRRTEIEIESLTP